jgi:hypothetical protein
MTPVDRATLDNSEKLNGRNGYIQKKLVYFENTFYMYRESRYKTDKKSNF